MTYCPLEYDTPSARLDMQTTKIHASMALRDLRGLSTGPANDLSVVLPAVSLETFAYKMFTSGTKSEPKASTLSYGAVAQYVRQANVSDGLKPGSRVLPSLQIDSLYVRPLILGLLTLSSVLTLRTVILGGEIISPGFLEQSVECVDLYDSFGPTETAVQVFIHRTRRGTCVAYDAAPGNLVILVNRDGEVCYADEPGEVLIADNQVFEGYYVNKIATEGALARLPVFGNTRFYRTGDLGVYTPGLRLHPAVYRAVVSDVQGRLQAVVQAHEPKQELETMEIMDFCKIHLLERLVSIVSQEGVKVAQASSIQRQFFLSQEQLGNTTYIVPLLYRVMSRDLSKILDTIQKIVQHREIFRTTFDLEGNTVMQKVVAYARYNFEVDDLR
ncbi:hypothetical protein PENCOP_c002G01845 [Penicillium coprophilum]|uniref:AMP-dependent synthetase/ligase domain-containing protein n=1 Tax=Penicillium coprophilum TaxID=36646 RepID=A0A1V6V1S8_9EURO|nr:hypothetical protein PENCOP_c002G01845 [Penicillium coprophilum]